jgi:hypothetical protein
MELTQEQALSVLVQAVRFAQSKGVYTLEDAEVISKACKVFYPAQEEPKAETESTETETKVEESQA